jgi:hypothetical protein
MNANLLTRPRNNKIESRVNFYINLILEVKGTKERLRRLFQSAPALKGKGNSAVKIRSMTQSCAAGLGFILWIVSCLVAILDLFKAAHSEQPLLRRRTLILRWPRFAKHPSVFLPRNQKSKPTLQTRRTVTIHPQEETRL